MRWNKHVDIITTKATNQLNFIKRNLSKCSTDVKSMAYTTIVRPHLEFASAAWDPYTKTNVIQIEAVQRRAARSDNIIVNNKITINLPEDLKKPRNHHSQSFIQLSTVLIIIIIVFSQEQYVSGTY